MIRSRSIKRAKQEREYAKIRKVYLFTHPICGVEHCYDKATEIHHMKGRTGDLLTNEKYFMPVCRAHHNYIESHPIEAKEHGYSLTRTI